MPTRVIEVLTFEPQYDKTNKMTSAPSKGSYQPGHPPIIIRVFAVHMKKPWVLSYPLSAQIRLIRLESAQNLCWLHMSFCCAAAHVWYLSHRRPVKAQASLRIRAVSPEPSLLAHMKYGHRRSVLPKFRHLASTGWLHMRVWRMSLWRTKRAIISWHGSYLFHDFLSN